ncbi:hypothetical protein EVAR_38375_1 [Eumeta japonica]|uniref:Uncharacterized protein n=1 Tax=Eumeta variegata TaxID=151549 RepID=A0A4C1Y055_EUMVA|nr:hypothetical protein EVAR_38375_1 [Eumeta japonica]
MQFRLFHKGTLGKGPGPEYDGGPEKPSLSFNFHVKLHSIFINVLFGFLKGSQALCIQRPKQGGQGPLNSLIRPYTPLVVGDRTAHSENSLRTHARSGHRAAVGSRTHTTARHLPLRARMADSAAVAQSRRNSGARYMCDADAGCACAACKSIAEVKVFCPFRMYMSCEWDETYLIAVVLRP